MGLYITPRSVVRDQAFILYTYGFSIQDIPSTFHKFLLKYLYSILLVDHANPNRLPVSKFKNVYH